MALRTLESRPSQTRTLSVRTAAWYGDRDLELPMPSSWSLRVHRPGAAADLTPDEIRARLDHPLGQASLSELARGKSRPVVIVDDLNRPTPAGSVVPALLAQFREAGIQPSAVTFLMAPGTHGAPREGALARKVGPEAAAVCTLEVHDCRRDTVRIGRTSRGTTVEVNRHVAESDLVVGIGGVYPNQTAGFGGGTKLALGVLSFRTIRALHYGHEPAGWGKVDGERGFRRELDEVAALIGLRFSVTLLVGSERGIVDMRAGAPSTCWHELIEPAHRLYRSAAPDGADVVIANAYPNDLSVTFVVMKGMAALELAPPAASRIAIAAAPEGVGLHQLFPIAASRGQRQSERLRRAAALMLRRPDALGRKLARRVRRLAGPPASRRRPWLYVPFAESAARLPGEIAGMRVASSWEQVTAAVTAEQGGRADLAVDAYACAPLQWLEVSRP
jgi:lactate racemase